MKKKKLHHSSHTRLIRWTLPVSRDMGEHNEQAESTSVCSVQVGHKPGVRVTSSGQYEVKYTGVGRPLDSGWPQSRADFISI